MLKKGKSPGVDNIPGKLIQAGGQLMIIACIKSAKKNKKIWTNIKWPQNWTRSLIITLPKKGDLKLCNNYRTLSFICHQSKILLRIILNRLKQQAKEIIAEEQAGFMKGRAQSNRSSISDPSVIKIS